MSSYIAFLYGGIKAYSGNALDDGKKIASQCIRDLIQLEDSDQFPPRLLVLLVSPPYLEPAKAQNLLNGIHQTFTDAKYPDIPLIGCSTAGVFFDRRIYREGALLICFASCLLRAEVAVGENAAKEPELAVGHLLKKLKLHADLGKDRMPVSNRTLFTFFPGYDNNAYPAPVLHKTLRRDLHTQLPIFGGVASANDPERMRPGILFAGKEIHQDAIIAASVAIGMPLGISLKHGIGDGQRILRVNRLSEDSRAIHGFHEGFVSQIIEQEHERESVLLLAEICANCETSIETPKLSPDGKSLLLTRKIRENACFRTMHPKATEIHATIKQGIAQAIDNAHIENPIACLAFKCVGLLRTQQKIGLDFEREFVEIEQNLDVHHNGQNEKLYKYVGAFVDGEAGVDDHGKSMLGNWNTSVMVIGDEISARTPTYQGFARLAELARAPMADPEESISRLLALIRDIGFRGAMISFWMPDQQEEMIIAKGATGKCFEKIVEATRRSIYSTDILVLVAKQTRPRFIVDSRRLDESGDWPTPGQTDLISQYIIPLRNLQGKVNAILQFDLGDISYRKELYPSEASVLNAIGDIIISILNRVFSGTESKIMLELDAAMKKCISAENVNEGLQKFLELALKAFDLKAGQIRLAQEEKQSLSLLVGVGKLFEESKKFRLEIDFGDISPLAWSFREQKATIINDARNNREHVWMCNRHRENKHTAVHDELMAIGSYANVPFITESGERGTIGMYSDEPWFFTWFHKAALEALGVRAGLLLENLRRKYSEKFLLSVNPRLSQMHNLNEPGKVLASATERLARAINAQYASLFLWDEAQEIYLLRAQHGWHAAEWVNAARYGKKDTWAGSVTLAGAPRYIPDLQGFYQKQDYEERGRYNKEIFGRELSADFTVEAIGLPLRIADEQIGVMMLYREIGRSEPSGFLTTDRTLLTAAAASLTSLVKFLDSNSFDRWEKEELRRHKQIYEASASKADNDLFESRVCRQTLKSYNAAGIDFYAMESFVPEWIAGFERTIKAQKPTRRLQPPADFLSPAQLLKIKNSSKTLIWRRKLEDEQKHDPHLAVTAGLVERAFIPLLGDNQLVGLLDLRWDITREHANSFVYRHSNAHLSQLGEMIGAAYRQHQLAQNKEEAELAKKETERLQIQAKALQRELDERSEQAVKATGAYVFQGAHRMSNVIQRIYSHLQIARHAQFEEKRSSELAELEEAIGIARRLLNSSIDKGERLLHLSQDEHSLASIIRDSMHTLENDKRRNIDFKMELAEDIVVRVDPELTKEVFINLLDNAINAMHEREKRELNITSSVLNLNTIELSIKDTGKGMSDEDIQAALRGFVRTREHKGVGVLISKVLLNVMGGTLNYKRIGNVGMETLVSLPLARLGANL